MPTHITQIEDSENGRTVLRVAGEMTAEDALLLERIAADIQTEMDTNISVDLADLDFLDSESAAILRRLDQRSGISIEGIETFLQTAVNAVEKQGADRPT